MGTRWLDVRIAVVFDDGADGDAWLVEAGCAAPPHSAVEQFASAPIANQPVGCACCACKTGYRGGPAAEALRRLFLRRARGETPLFARVRVRASEGGVATVRAALSDPVIGAWFREPVDK